MFLIYDTETTSMPEFFHAPLTDSEN